MIPACYIVAAGKSERKLALRSMTGASGTAASWEPDAWRHSLRDGCATCGGRVTLQTLQVGANV